MQQNAAPGVVPERHTADAISPKLESLRRFTSKASALLSVLRYGLLGGMSLALGMLFLWAGLSGTFAWKPFGLGAGLIAVGIWFLRIARTAWQSFREPVS